MGDEEPSMAITTRPRDGAAKETSDRTSRAVESTPRLERAA